VLNQTGLKGDYDFDLKWTPDSGLGAPRSVAESDRAGADQQVADSNGRRSSLPFKNNSG
jgi:uncharacterized protein (TIGR03435 family)